MKTTPEAKSQGPRTGRLLFVALAAAAFGGLTTALLMSYSQPTVSTANAEPAIPAGVSLTSWFDNGKGGQHVLRIVDGNAPPVGIRLVGTVKSDTDCDPDAQGLNHCHNDIDLGNGRVIAVVNNHAMTRYPCLAPGQQLSITRLDANWVVAYEKKTSRLY
jgi:hypothetical protein